MARASFDERFDVLARIAYRVAFRLLGNRADAEEIAQETLARALARWHSVSGHDEPWVTRVATNLAIGRLRKRRPTTAFDEAHGGPAPVADAHALERLTLADAISRLPRRQREVVALRYLADLPEREVAALMRTSVGSVKKHSSRALDRLRLDLALEADDV